MVFLKYRNPIFPVVGLTRVGFRPRREGDRATNGEDMDCLHRTHHRYRLRDLHPGRAAEPNMKALASAVGVVPVGRGNY